MRLKLCGVPFILVPNGIDAFRYMNQYYVSKARASFHTKSALFIYEHILSPEKWPFNLVSFIRFQITPAVVRDYTAAYWQGDYTDKIRGHEIRTKMAFSAYTPHN